MFVVFSTFLQEFLLRAYYSLRWFLDLFEINIFSLASLYFEINGAHKKNTTKNAGVVNIGEWSFGIFDKI